MWGCVTLLGCHDLSISRARERRPVRSARRAQPGPVPPSPQNSAALPPGRVRTAPSRRGGTKAPGAQSRFPPRAARARPALSAAPWRSRAALPPPSCRHRRGGSSSAAPRSAPAAAPRTARSSPAAAPARPSQAPEPKCRARPPREAGTEAAPGLSAAPAGPARPEGLVLLWAPHVPHGLSRVLSHTNLDRNHFQYYYCYFFS